MKTKLFSLIPVGQVFEVEGIHYEKVDAVSAVVVKDATNTEVRHRFYPDSVVHCLTSEGLAD